MTASVQVTPAGSNLASDPSGVVKMAGLPLKDDANWFRPTERTERHAKEQAPPDMAERPPETTAVDTASESSCSTEHLAV